MADRESTFTNTRWFFQSQEQTSSNDREVIQSATEILGATPQIAKMVQHMIGQRCEKGDAEQRRVVNEAIWGAVLVANEFSTESIQRLNSMDWVVDTYESFAFTEVDARVPEDVSRVVANTMEHIYGDKGELAAQAFGFGLNLIQYFDERAQEYELAPA